MSTIWTPSGERPIRREPETPPSAGPAALTGPSAPPGTPEEEMSEEELRAHLAEVQRQVAQTPAEVVVANHAIGLFQLAVIHLDQSPPNLKGAQLAIDAMAGMVEKLGSRLGEEEAPLREALAQLQMAFVQRRNTAGDPAASG